MIFQVRIRSSKFSSNKLNERLIEEFAKRNGWVRIIIPVDLALLPVRGITRSPFAHWIEKESKSKDYNPPALDKFEGNFDQMTHLIQFRQKNDVGYAKWSNDVQIIAITLSGKALT